MLQTFRQKLHLDGDPSDVDGIAQKAVTVCTILYSCHLFAR